ncbi:Protein NEDD1 [Euphorbia peplus]|nr:Protein NEDD1 [Euphorbia peplus]
MDQSLGFLAATGGDTVKIFDVKVGEQQVDRCILTYIPSPGCLVNSVKWNHTNLVLASAGEDKKISLWRRSGQSMGTIPVAGTESVDNIEESMSAISFSNKGSRYICSGGSGQVVRIWDLQRKRCIKWLKGHSSTITGVLYNCKDEHLASISLNGDLILHNLASGARAAELKDPNEQVLRVLDYSRISRHLLVTAGDDGTVHLWDTTGRSPKVSWSKQHSAPTAGISFSPSNDKIIASVGLDKKLYTYDSGSRRPTSSISYEAPFSSLAFRDDGWILAAGTSNGRVVFYDVRGKLQPFTVLRAYSNSEAVVSLCWERSKPVIVNESNCTAETALLGGAVEDSILMPDPLPSVTSSSVPVSNVVSSSLNSGRSRFSAESSYLASTSSSLASSALNLSLEEGTPYRSHVWPSGTLSRLHAPRSFKDDMEVFSPLVDVQPITPSLNKLWEYSEGSKKDNLLLDKKPSSLFPPSVRKFPFAEDVANDHPIFDWTSSTTSRQDDTRTSFSMLGGSTPSPSSKIEEPSITPPEAWGGSMFSGLQELSSSTSQTTNSNINYSNLRPREVSLNPEASTGSSEHILSSSMSQSLGAKSLVASAILDMPGLTPPRKFSTYAERISTTASFSDGMSLSGGSPKLKKTGAETREELLGSLLSRSDTSALEPGTLPAVNGGISQPSKALQVDSVQGSSFTLQLFQGTLEETLDSFQKSIHEDMRNLHIEILRQFHMQEMQFSGVMKSVMENQAELMNEIKSLRKENQELRQLL